MPRLEMPMLPVPAAPAPPQPTVVSIGSRALADALVLLLPVATAALQYLKQERSYELIFLAAAIAGLYFIIRGMSQQIVQLRAELVQERAAHASTRSSCEEHEKKFYGDLQHAREIAAADLEAMRKGFIERIDQIQERRRIESGVLQTSMVNLYNDLSAGIVDKSKLGSFKFNTTTQMVEYVGPSAAAAQTFTITQTPGATP